MNSILERFDPAIIKGIETTLNAEVEQRIYDFPVYIKAGGMGIDCSVVIKDGQMDIELFTEDYDQMVIERYLANQKKLAHRDHETEIELEANFKLGFNFDGEEVCDIELTPIDIADRETLDYAHDQAVEHLRQVREDERADYLYGQVIERGAA